jgi:hypothetical protein
MRVIKVEGYDEQQALRQFSAKMDQAYSLIDSFEKTLIEIDNLYQQADNVTRQIDDVKAMLSVLTAEFWKSMPLPTPAEGHSWEIVCVDNEFVVQEVPYGKSQSFKDFIDFMKKSYDKPNRKALAAGVLNFGHGEKHKVSY